MTTAGWESSACRPEVYDVVTAVSQPDSRSNRTSFMTSPVSCPTTKTLLGRPMLGFAWDYAIRTPRAHGPTIAAGAPVSARNTYNFAIHIGDADGFALRLADFRCRDERSEGGFSGGQRAAPPAERDVAWRVDGGHAFVPRDKRQAGRHPVGERRVLPRWARDRRDGLE